MIVNAVVVVIWLITEQLALEGPDGASIGNSKSEGDQLVLVCDCERYVAALQRHQMLMKLLLGFRCSGIDLLQVQ